MTRLGETSGAKVYIDFVEWDQPPITGKTKVWNIISRGSGRLLGQIRWYGPWRQYCFYPTAETLFNVGCMGDIIAFIEAHKKDRR